METTQTKDRQPVADPPIAEPLHKTLMPHIDIIDKGYSFMSILEWATKDRRLHCKVKEAGYSGIRTYHPEYVYVISLDGEQIALIPYGKVGDVYNVFRDYVNGLTVGKHSFTEPMERSGESEYRLDFNTWEGITRVYYDDVPLGELRKNNEGRTMGDPLPCSR